MDSDFSETKCRRWRFHLMGGCVAGPRALRIQQPDEERALPRRIKERERTFAR